MQNGPGTRGRDLGEGQGLLLLFKLSSSIVIGGEGFGNCNFRGDVLFIRFNQEAILGCLLQKMVYCFSFPLVL